MLTIAVYLKPISKHIHWQGHYIKRYFWMGGLTLWAAQPIPMGVWGHASPGNLFNVYALKISSGAF